MDISVGANADVNPKDNLGKLLKMFRGDNSDYSTVQEKNTDGSGDDTEKENNFLQILQKKLNVFLNSDKTQNVQDSAAKEDLRIALEKLLMEDQAAAGDLLSGLAFLAIEGQTGNLSENVEDPSEKSFSTLIGETGLTGIRQEETSTTVDQKKSNGSIVMPDDATGGVVEEINPAKTGKLPASESSLTKPEESFFGINTEDKTIVDGVKEKVIAELNARDKGMETKSQSPMTLLKDIQGNSIQPPGIQAAVPSYEEELKKVSSENRHSVIPLRNTEGIALDQKVSEENQSIKTSVNDEGTLWENKSRLNIANGALNSQEQAGENFEKIVSAKPDVLSSERQPSPPASDAPKNITEKITATTDEQAAMANKMKTEFKGKTVPNEKNIESHSLNSSNVSLMSSAKTTAGDVLPVQIISRVAAEFHENLTGEGGRVKITLAPPSLGTLEMDVIVRNNTVKVMLIADNKDVQQMLSGNLDSLKGSLQSQGLTIQRCDVMMQDHREQHSQGFNQQAFNQEQSAKHHYDEGKGYHQDTQTITPLKIKPMNQSTETWGNISLFA